MGFAVLPKTEGVYNFLTSFEFVKAPTTFYEETISSTFFANGLMSLAGWTFSAFLRDGKGLAFSYLG